MKYVPLSNNDHEIRATAACEIPIKTMDKMASAIIYAGMPLKAFGILFELSILHFMPAKITIAPVNPNPAPMAL